METRIKRFWIGTGVIFFIGCASITYKITRTESNVRHGPSALHQAIKSSAPPNGALIFRRGKGTEADAVVLAQGGGSWSHVGLIVSEPNGISVIHAAPSEEQGQPNVVKEDTLEYFLAEERASDGTIMVVRDATKKDAEIAINTARHLIGKPFGIHPRNGTSADEIYCTELVLQAWQSAGVTLTRKRDLISLPFFAGVYLLPDTLAASFLLKSSK